MIDDEENEEEQAKMLEELKKRGKIRENLKHTLENMEYLQNDLTDIKKSKFQAMNESLNQTFESIHHPRELTLDAVGMKLLSHSLKSQAIKLSDFSKKHNFESLTTKLKDYFCFVDEKGQAHIDRIDWGTLGAEVSKMMLTTAPLNTMVGPFHKQEKVRKPITKRKSNEEDKFTQVEKPKEIIQTGDDDKNEATNERVKNLITIVRALTDEINDQRNTESSPSNLSDSDVGFDLLKLLVDPVDDVQTIENFFDFSFLIKEKTVCQALNNDDLPIAFAANFDDEENIPKKQMVLTLNTKDLRQLRELLYGNSIDKTKVKHPLHRNDEIYKKSLAAITAAASSSSAPVSSHGKENHLNRDDSDNEPDRNKSKEKTILKKRQSSKMATPSASQPTPQAQKKQKSVKDFFSSSQG